jgi:hypothetical protein
MKKLLLGCALAVPALVGVANLMYAPPAQAAPAQSCEWDYYSDASYSEHVGWSVLTCSGRSYSSGTSTPYYQVLCSPC